ncbi:MAG: hypothetical protein ACLR9S_00195 [Lachnospiraceae bacterium]
MNTFPKGMNDDYQRIEKGKIISSMLFGNRFKADQTLYEYLIEFLLVYSSAKDSDLETGKMQFHDVLIERKLSYWVEPRMALRRFIFYDKARKTGTIKADEKAYQEMIKILKGKMDGMSEDEKTEYIESIQDLFHGYAVVIKKRFWGAQALLPICPEFMLCGCDPTEKKRKEYVDWDNNPETVDTLFSFDKRNFLARGGELYYLHLLQGLQENPEKKEVLERLLNDLIGVQCEKISKMASFVQESWEEEMHFDKEELAQQLRLSFIPENAYVECEKSSVDELINYLSCKMHPINRVEILSKGIMLQIMRMMSNRVANYLGIEKRNWIIDMKGSSNDTVKKIAADSYGNLESDFMTALNKIARELDLSEEETMVQVQKAKKDSLDIFRAKGKEMQCIIPSKGAFERFSLSEDVIRFLVLALIAPEEKMTLNMFLEKLYDHYGMVIGPNEYRKSLESDTAIDVSLASSFVENEIAFQNFLKETGFLRELSDATSIVTNPYTSILKEGE